MALAFRRSSHRLILLRYAVCPFSSTPRSCLLVSPPDPISNIRHVIYDEGTATREGVKEGFSKHPYSLSEFSQDSFDSATGQNELQLKLQRQQLDTLDQQFWTDVCIIPVTTLLMHELLFFFGDCRATSVLKLGKPTSFPVFLKKPLHHRKNKHFPNSTNNG